MKTTLSILISLFSFGLMAQTYIYDRQEISGTWSTKGSPYIIKGEAIVPAGKTLKIKPGVKILFKAGINRYYDESGFDVGLMRVNGNIEAKGKEGKRIEFSRDGYGNWGCIYVNSRNSNNLFAYCNFQNGYFVRAIIPGDNATGVLTFNNSGGEVQHCLFVNNGWNGINCKNGAAPLISHVTITESNYAFECNSGSIPKVENSIFYGNENSFYLNGGSKPVISYSLIEVSVLPTDVQDGGHNILNKDPQFMNPESNLFDLYPGSPCIGTARDGKNMGAF